MTTNQPPATSDQPPDPCAIVIFGATGDLTRRKLLPALYQLCLAGMLPRHFGVVGFARREMAPADWRRHIRDSVKAFARSQPVDDAVLDALTRAYKFIAASFDDPQGYRRLADCLDELDREAGTSGNCIFYLATPPDSFATIVEQLGAAGLSRQSGEGRGWARVIVEKPFGHDRQTAVGLNQVIHQSFDESQVYRIDHYLGKETVQNIILFRFANSIFEPVWSRQFVDHVQITVAETVGVEGRAGYYERAGVLRDILQNHMLQLLTLTAMEAPTSFMADAVRDEKLKVLKSLRPIRPAEDWGDIVRGQYAAGTFDGAPVVGYLREPGVRPGSRTETYLAAKVFLDNWRWADVPFYLRSGKRLAARATEIAIQFKKVPLSLFGRRGMQALEPNLLTLRIQPDEGITLRSNSKVPGAQMGVQPVDLEFSYGRSFGRNSPEAYERLLMDSIEGDSTLFTRADEVEEAWRFVDGMAEACDAAGPGPLPQYPAGSWGPPEAAELMEREGRAWRRLGRGRTTEDR